MVLKFVREQSITCMKNCTKCKEPKNRRLFDRSPRTKKPYPRCRKCRRKRVSEWEERRAAVRSGYVWCTKCKQAKKEADFDESKSGKHFPWCRECRLPVIRECRICGGDIVGRKYSRTCSDLCELRARNDARIKAVEMRRKWLSSEKGKRYLCRQAELTVGRTKRRRAKAKEVGLCIVCVKRKARPERVTCEECGKKGNFYNLKANRKKRKVALKCFGSQCCCCCGETESKFLVITAEKKVICYNCRFAIVMFGVCPHQELENAKVSE